MLTLDEARAVFERFAVAEPLIVDGTLHVAEWYEDEYDFLPVWGAREFHVDGDHSRARWDQRAVFIDKQTGCARLAHLPDHFDKVDAMKPVPTSS